MRTLDLIRPIGTDLHLAVKKNAGRLRTETDIKHAHRRADGGWWLEGIFPSDADRFAESDTRFDSAFRRRDGSHLLFEAKGKLDPAAIRHIDEKLGFWMTRRGAGAFGGGPDGPVDLMIAGTWITMAAQTHLADAWQTRWSSKLRTLEILILRGELGGDRTTVQRVPIDTLVPLLS